MPVTVVTPSSQGTSNDATLVAGASKPVAMAADDGNTTYITITPPGQLNDNYKSTLWPTNVGYVSAISHTFKGGKDSGTCTLEGSFTCTHGSVAGMTTTTAAAYQTITTDILALHPGGGAWTQADFDSAVTQFGVKCSGAGGVGRFSYVQVSITWEAPVGGFAFLLGLAGLVASPISRVMDFNQFMQFIAWRDGFKLSNEEIIAAWREIKSYRHPVFFGGMNGKLAVG